LGAGRKVKVDGVPGTRGSGVEIPIGSAPYPDLLPLRERE
jgi:hypothetical protein